MIPGAIPNVIGQIGNPEVFPAVVQGFGLTPAIANADQYAKLKFGSNPSAVTTTSNVMSDVTGHSFTIGVNEGWAVEWCIDITSTAVAGTKFQVTGPASPTGVLGLLVGTTTAAGVLNASSFTAFSTVSPAYATAAVGILRLRLFIANGANAGTIQLQFASTTNTQTSTVGPFSNFVATKRIVN